MLYHYKKPACSRSGCLGWSTSQCPSIETGPGSSSVVAADSGSSCCREVPRWPGFARSDQPTSRLATPVPLVSAAQPVVMRSGPMFSQSSGVAGPVDASSATTATSTVMATAAAAASLVRRLDCLLLAPGPHYPVVPLAGGLDLTGSKTEPRGCDLTSGLAVRASRETRAEVEEYVAARLQSREPRPPRVASVGRDSGSGPLASVELSRQSGDLAAGPHLPAYLCPQTQFRLAQGHRPQPLQLAYPSPLMATVSSTARLQPQAHLHMPYCALAQGLSSLPPAPAGYCQARLILTLADSAQQQVGPPPPSHPNESLLPSHLLLSQPASTLTVCHHSGSSAALYAPSRLLPSSHAVNTSLPFTDRQAWLRHGLEPASFSNGLDRLETQIRQNTLKCCTPLPVALTADSVPSFTQQPISTSSSSISLSLSLSHSHSPSTSPSSSLSPSPSISPSPSASSSTSSSTSRSPSPSPSQSPLPTASATHLACPVAMFAQPKAFSSYPYTHPPLPHSQPQQPDQCDLHQPYQHQHQHQMQLQLQPQHQHLHQHQQQQQRQPPSHPQSHQHAQVQFSAHPPLPLLQITTGQRALYAAPFLAGSAPNLVGASGHPNLLPVHRHHPACRFAQLMSQPPVCPPSRGRPMQTLICLRCLSIRNWTAFEEWKRVEGYGTAAHQLHNPDSNAARRRQFGPIENREDWNAMTTGEDAELRQEGVTSEDQEDDGIDVILKDIKTQLKPLHQMRYTTHQIGLFPAASAATGQPDRDCRQPHPMDGPLLSARQPQPQHDSGSVAARLPETREPGLGDYEGAWKRGESSWTLNVSKSHTCPHSVGISNCRRSDRQRQPMTTVGFRDLETRVEELAFDPGVVLPSSVAPRGVSYALNRCDSDAF
ncbi:unnamed protein product [Protopolystoma xenopodis]|uniref:Uncharacterized protein n=1 Tax=Protopolystoma xenopodis TaxID=117903 RepID=A0A3S4ZPB9_9PLAT|nr:unnamed protein product [Protopolystoma xenopodis]